MKNGSLRRRYAPLVVRRASKGRWSTAFYYGRFSENAKNEQVTGWTNGHGPTVFNGGRGPAHHYYGSGTRTPGKPAKIVAARKFSNRDFDGDDHFSHADDAEEVDGSKETIRPSTGPRCNLNVDARTVFRKRS